MENSIIALGITLSGKKTPEKKSIANSKIWAKGPMCLSIMTNPAKMKPKPKKAKKESNRMGKDFSKMEKVREMSKIKTPNTKTIVIKTESMRIQLKAKPSKSSVILIGAAMLVSKVPLWSSLLIPQT